MYHLMLQLINNVLQQHSKCWFWSFFQSKSSLQIKKKKNLTIQIWEKSSDQARIIYMYMYILRLRFTAADFYKSLTKNMWLPMRAPWLCGPILLTIFPKNFIKLEQDYSDRIFYSIDYEDDWLFYFKCWLFYLQWELYINFLNQFFIVAV